MKREFTALTLPRISGGVASCSSDPRIITLIMFIVTFRYAAYVTTLQMSFAQASWLRVIQMLPLPFCFISITNAAYVGMEFTKAALKRNNIPARELQEFLDIFQRYHGDIVETPNAK